MSYCLIFGSTRSIIVVEEFKGHVYSNATYAKTVRTSRGTTKISSKYQIVIPREVRERAGLREGQMLYVYSTAEGEIQLSAKSPLDRAREYFRGTKMWGDDPAATIRRDREESDKRSAWL